MSAHHKIWITISIEKMGRKNTGKQHKVPLDLQFLEHLWLPDLDIYNVKHIKDFKVLKKLAGITQINKELRS